MNVDDFYAPIPEGEAAAGQVVVPNANGIIPTKPGAEPILLYAMPPDYPLAKTHKFGVKVFYEAPKGRPVIRAMIHFAVGTIGRVNRAFGNHETSLSEAIERAFETLILEHRKTRHLPTERMQAQCQCLRDLKDQLRDDMEGVQLRIEEGVRGC